MFSLPPRRAVLATDKRGTGRGQARRTEYTTLTRPYRATARVDPPAVPYAWREARQAREHSNLVAHRSLFE